MGRPRVANRLLRRVRDFAEVRGEGFIDGATASEGLELFGVDELGLDKVDRAILTTLCTRFGGQPVGLTTLSQCVGEEPDTIEDAYEPYLVQTGSSSARRGAGWRRSAPGFTSGTKVRRAPGRTRPRSSDAPPAALRGTAFCGALPLSGCITRRSEVTRWPE